MVVSGDLKRTGALNSWAFRLRSRRSGCFRSSIRFRQKDGGASSVVTVRQAPRSAVLADSLVYHVPAEGGLLEINLQSNISYTATVQYSAQGWLSIQEEAGTRVLTPSVCRVQVGGHSGRTLREGTVTFAPADASVKALWPGVIATE